MSTVFTSSLVERLRADGKLPAGWAAAVNAVSRERFDGRFDVRQYGPRRLWDEAEAAYRWWQRAGEPPLEAWELTVSPDEQSFRLAR